MSLRTIAPLLALIPMLIASEAFCADELQIQGRFGGSGKPVYESARFGQGLRVENLHESVIYPGCGSIRPEAGSIELWLKVIEETGQGGGRSWRPLLSAPPLDSQFGLPGGQSQLSLIFTADSEKPFTPSALSFGLRTQEIKKAETQTIAWKAGSEHHVVATWGERGMEIYADGDLVATGPKVNGAYLDAQPSCLIFGRHPYLPPLFSKMLFDEIKISDIQRDASYISAAFKSGKAPELDANTLLLSHLDSSLDASGVATEWRKAQTFTTLRSAWQCNLDLELDKGNIFLNNEPNALHAFASRSAQKPEAFTLECVAKDFLGNEAFKSSKAIQLQAKADFQDIELPLKPGLAPGYYSATLKLVDSKGATAAESKASFCILADSIKQTGGTLWGFNIYDDYRFSFNAVKRMGIGLLRGHGVYFWPYAEPLKGDFDFAPSKAFSENSAKYGIRVLGILGNSPLWAGTPPDNLKDFVGGRNYEKALEFKERYRPRNIEEWREYVAKTVAANPQVADWEIWNEPDWHLPQTQGFGFGGTTAQYFDLLKAAHGEIKKVNPDTRVVYGGIACAAVADQNFSRDLVKMGAVKYIDLLGMHPYGGQQFFKEQLEIFRKGGYKGEAWQSEYVPDCFGQFQYPKLGQELAWEQPRHIVSMLGFGISAYVIHDINAYFPYGQPSEACFGVAQLFRKLNGMKPAGALSQNAFMFDGEGKTLVTLWGKDAVSFKSNATKLLLTDCMGFSRELDAKDGSAAFTPGNFLYVEAAPGQKIDLSTVRLGQPLPDALPVNGSFDDYEGDGGIGSFIPRNWDLSTYHRDGKMRVDVEVKKSGSASLLLERGADAEAGTKVSIFQLLPASCNGQDFELKAWIKTEFAAGSKGAATVTVWDLVKKVPYGVISVTESNQGFTLYSAKVPIPKDASGNITIGCSLTDGKSSKAWFDAIELKPLVK